MNKFILKAVVASMVAAMSGGLAMAAQTAIKPPSKSYLRPATVPTPADNQITPARIELGKALYFDPRLSGSNWISCGTCHNPTLGWSDALPTAIGDGQHVLHRATPTILNTAYNAMQMWDGRFKTLEEQAVGPVQAAGEMNQEMGSLLAELKEIKGYHPLFEAAYPGEGITDKTIGKAIATYERTIVSGESPFDRWVKGNQKAVSESAKRGFTLFEGKGACVVCHSGFNFTDDGFHNLGLKEAGEPDPGRYGVVKVPRNMGAFKTPTLRDVALTAPYMHNGMYKTLDEVVDHYNRGGDVKQHLSPNIAPLNLTAQEKADLVEFLKSLTGEQVKVVLPVLPQ